MTHSCYTDVVSCRHSYDTIAIRPFAGSTQHGKSVSPSTPYNKGVQLTLVVRRQSAFGVACKVLLWLDYYEQYPGGYRYSQFCEHYQRWRGKLAPSKREVRRPGEKAFSDFSGQRPQLMDRDTGKPVAVELFVGVLGASSHTCAAVVVPHDDSLHNVWCFT